MFTTVDPDAGGLDDPRSRHRYLYAEAAPLTYTDPAGLTSLSIVEISFVNALAAGLSAFVFTPATSTALERLLQGVTATNLGALSSLATLSLTYAVFASIAATVASAGVAASIFFGILSSGILTANFEQELCDLPSVAITTAVVTVATAGLYSQFTAPAKSIARAVIDFVFDALPPFAADYLGGRLAPL